MIRAGSCSSCMIASSTDMCYQVVTSIACKAAVPNDLLVAYSAFFHTALGLGLKKLENHIVVCINPTKYAIRAVGAQMTSCFLLLFHPSLPINFSLSLPLELNLSVMFVLYSLSFYSFLNPSHFIFFCLYLFFYQSNLVFALTL